MWIVTTNRDGLLMHLAANKRNDLLRGATQQSQSLRLKAEEIAMLWESQPHSAENLPEVIVVADGELRSFLAWTSTYLDGFRPFTSLCRVLDTRTFEKIREAAPPRQLGRVGPACAAIILADALTQGMGRVDESSITIAACESTYSFARSRFTALGIRDDAEILQRKWSLAREIGRQPRRRLSPDSAEPLWILLEALAGSPRGEQHVRWDMEFYHLCNDYMRVGWLPIEFLKVFALSTSVQWSAVAEAMSGSREQRVTVLEDMLRGPSLRKLTGLEGDFVRGYLASLLSPGTIEYLSLVSSYLDEYPMLLMWYAFFAGLHPESKVLSQFGGLCRRLLKDVEQRDMLFERPRCDISVEELEVLAATGLSGLTYIRGGAQGSVRVELYPTLSAPVRLTPSASDQPMLFEPVTRDPSQVVDNSEVREAASLYSDVAAAIAILESVYSQLHAEGSKRNDRPNEKRKRSRRK